MASTINATTSSGIVATADNTGQLALQAAGTTIATVSSTGLAVTGTIASSTGTTYPIVSGTAQASTSGTSITFTDIPSWVKRITVMLNGVSLSGTANLLVQIGTGGTATTSGYTSASTFATINTSATGGVTSTAGFIMYVAAASYVDSGHFVLTNVSGNIWVCSGMIGNTVSVPYTGQTGGTVTLGGALNMVRITTSNGTDTFDAGTINILYE